MNLRYVLFEQMGDAIIPQRARPHLKKYFLKAGLIKVPYELFGAMIYLSMALTLLVYLVKIYPMLSESLRLFGYTIQPTSANILIFTFVFWAITQLMLVLALMLLIKVYFDVKIYNRTKKIEELLPLYLQSVSTNLRAGLSFDRALLNSVEPEYKVLEKEIEIVAKKKMAGQDVGQALMEFAEKYDSPILKESMDLLIIGLRGGGEISALLDRLVDNLQKIDYMKRETMATVMSNVIFITLIALAVSPILFALSFNLLLVIQSLGAQLSKAGAAMMTISIGNISISHEDFITFSRLSVAVIAIAASIIITDMRSENIKAGAKIIPIYIAIALVVYEVALKAMTFMFKLMFGF